MHAALALLAPLFAQPTFAGDTWWRTEVAFETGDKFGGCAIGDVDPQHPGNEIAVVAGSGAITVVGRTEGGWTCATIPAPAGEMIQCAIGDADPERPGNELVVVGMASGGEESGGPGVALLVFKDADGSWKSERIFHDEALVHGVAIGAGEVFVAGFSRQAHRVARESGKWKSERIAPLPGDGKSVAVHEGAVYVACTDGTLLRIARDGDAWTSSAADERPAGRARLGTSPLGVVVSDDDGVLSLLGSGGRVELFKDTAKLRGAVMADLDPSAPGLEAATAGYSGRLVVLYRREGGYEARPLFVDLHKFHHVAAGDLTEGPGLELAACGYAGRLYVLSCMQQ